MEKKANNVAGAEPADEHPDSPFDSKGGEGKYWGQYGSKYENTSILLRQMRQMKQTIRTLMEIDQEQHWRILELNDERNYLSQQIRELNKQLQELEEARGNKAPVSGAGDEARASTDYELVKLGPRSWVRRGGYQCFRRRGGRYRARGGRPPETLDEDDPALTERIRELMDSSENDPQLVLPFRYDEFAATLGTEPPGDMQKILSPVEAVRQSQYKTLAALFTETAGEERPKIQEGDTLPLIKKLENELREAIGGKSADQLARTILDVKEKKMGSLIDLAPAEKKLQELLSVPIVPALVPATVTEEKA